MEFLGIAYVDGPVKPLGRQLEQDGNHKGLSWDVLLLLEITILQRGSRVFPLPQLRYEYTSYHWTR